MKPKFMVVMAIIAITMFLTMHLSAQTVIPVSAGDGTLEAAIAGAVDGDIIELVDGGGIYIQSSGSNIGIDKTLTIRAQEGLAQKPIIRNTDASQTSARLFQMEAGGNLMLIGLELDGTIDGTTAHAKNAVRNENVAQVDSFAADYLKIYDCYIHDTTEPFVKGHAYTRLDTVIIKNTILYNCGREAVLLRESEAEGSPDVRYVEFENCTFANVVREAMYTDFNDPVIRINHCTFDSIGMGGGDRILYLRLAQDAEIKNSIFSNQGAYQDAMRIYGTSTISYCDTFNVGAIDLEESATIGVGMLGVDPLYTDPANLDYTLQPGSPVLGQADDGFAMGDLRWDPTAQGPKVHKIEAGDGTLQQAIWDAADGEIIELISSGGVYSNSDSSELAITKTLTIRAREGLAQMPIVRNTYAASTSARLFEIQAGGNLILIGLDLDGTIDGTTAHAKNAVRNENVAQVDSFASDYLKIYDCYIHDTTEPFVKGHAYTRLDTVIIKNTFLNNCGREAVLLRESSAEGSPDVRYVEFENCTFTNVVREAMYTDFNDPVIRINHCTFDSVGASSDRMLYLREAQDAQIKNSIFSNQLGTADAMRIYGTSTISYCDTFNVGAIDLEESASIGAGMLGVDPLYNNPAALDYRLADSSPVRGTADDGKAMGDLRWEASPGQYRLTVITEGQGIVTLDPTGNIYDPGTMVTLTADPDPGWKFKEWQGAAVFPPDNPVVTVTINSDTTVTAVFESLLPSYQLTVDTVGLGHVDIDPTSPDGLYLQGTEVMLTAVPGLPTWEFVEWTGDVTGSNNPVTVKMDSAIGVTANFASTLTQFTINIETVGMGSVALDPEPILGTYDTSMVVVLTAMPELGWEFEGWSGALTGSENPDTVQMDSNLTVTATFTETALPPGRRALEIDTSWGDFRDAVMFANNNSNVDSLILTTSGGVYTSTSSSDVVVMSPLFIVAAAGLAEKPILTNSDEDKSNLDILRVFDDLTLKGVILDGSHELSHGMKYGIRLRHYTNDSVKVGTNITVMDCEFRNLFESKNPLGDGHAFKIDVGVLAGTVRFERCTFDSLGYEAIRISDTEKWATDRTLDSLIVRNCTFVEIDAECVRYYSDLDPATPDAPVIVEHLTINSSATRTIYLKNSGGAIVRDIIISNSRQSGHGRDDDLLDGQGNTGVPSFVSYIDTFNVKTVPIKSTDGEVDTTSIFGFDPMYRDAPNRDFTLLAGSPMYGLAHDGSTMGDLRWVDPSVGIDEVANVMPTTYSLEQNYPNPFNPTTTIEFGLKHAGLTTLKVYDILGREVKTLIDKQMPAGYHKIHFRGADLATGIYFYRLKSGEFQSIKKMLLVK